MRIRTLSTTLALAAALAAPALAQSAAPLTQSAPRAQAKPRPAVPPAPAAPAAPGEPVPPLPPPAPPRRGQPVNVKIEVTITDQRGGATSLRKTVSVVTADGMNGRIRSQASYSGIGDVPLNVDVDPEMIADGKIRMRLALQYDLPGAPAPLPPDAPGGALRRTQIIENLNVVLENGKPLVAAQSADPVGDRQVTIEVKATVLR